MRIVGLPAGPAYAALALTMARTGIAGALRMGLEHGAHCLGCCWALMLLLFAGGVMDLTLIVGLTAIVLIEKFSPIPVLASRVLVVLILAGTGSFLR